MSPEVGDSVRCAPWSRENEVDPIGNAGVYDTLVLVEWPLPWPKDVGEIDELAGISRLPRTRVLAVPPTPDTDDVLVSLWHREASGTFVGTDHRVSHRSLGRTLHDLVGGASGPGAGRHGEACPPDVLICGHGQRDRCCGSLGVRLLAGCHDRWPGVRVRRCSHTGGHRFAPTGITLPAGRMWAYLDIDLLDSILSSAGEVGRLLPHYRGAMGFEPEVQVAERAAFAHFGWAWQHNVIVSADVSGDGADKLVHLSWTGHEGDGSAIARVGVGRVLPVPECGFPIRIAAKTSPEFSLISFSVTGGRG